MEIKKLNPDQTDDFRKLIEIFTEVFEHTAHIPGNQQLHKLISNPDFMVFVVRINETIVGGLTIYVLHQYYSTKPLAYIYDVAIATSFRGKGLGKALITAVCDFCRANGFDAAYVEAENDDSDAVDFYRKTTYSNEILARQFTYRFTSETH